MIHTKTYPGGEAGQYLCTCSNCRQQFYGFKGDVICQRCSDIGDQNKETHDYKRAFENEYAQHKLDLDALTTALARAERAEKQTTKVGVTAVIRDDAGRILLGLKGRAFSDDFKGKWVTPGGRVNFNETLEAATIREAMEETGVEIKIIRSLPPQEIIHKDGHFVFFAYEAQWVCGAPSAGDDLLEVKWCNEEMIGQISLTPLTKTVIESAQPSTLETRNRQLVQAMGKIAKLIDQARLFQDSDEFLDEALALLKEMGERKDETGPIR